MEASYFNVVLIELVCNWLKDTPFLHLFIRLFPYASVLYLWFVEWLSVYIVYGVEGQIKKKIYIWILPCDLQKHPWLLALLVAAGGCCSS